MLPNRSSGSSPARRTAVLVVFICSLSTWPCRGQTEAAPVSDSGPAAAAALDALQALRAAAAAGEASAEALAAAETIWLDQQADLIRSRAELEILALRSPDGCPPIDEIVQLVVDREHRAFQRLEQLRLLRESPPRSASTGLVSRPAEEEAVRDDPAALEEDRGQMHITFEPADPTEDHTP